MSANMYVIIAGPQDIGSVCPGTSVPFTCSTGPGLLAVPQNPLNVPQLIWHCLHHRIVVYRDYSGCHRQPAPNGS